VKAARVHRPGPPSAIAVEDIPIPSPGENEVLVRVRAAGVGPWDALVRTGASGLRQRYPLTLGAEISGTVERVGAKTSGFAPGDEVFGSTNALFVDGYAEYAVVAPHIIAKKPAALSHVQAAAVPVCAVTAWQMLFDHAEAVAGQTVAVYGAAGNVGGFALQFARLRGLKALAIVHGDDAESVRALGADRVIDSRLEALADFSRSVDVVIDAVGGPAQDQLIGMTKPGGAVISAVVQPNERLAADHRVRAEFFIVDVNDAQLKTIAELLGKKQVSVAVGAVLPLSEARAAHEMLEGDRPRPRGKMVLTPTAD
jgi:NADPH:quinone reductase-like Zn-dependent oxidoreductase